MRDGRNRRVALSLFLSLSRSSRLERGPSERLSPVDPANHSASHSTSRFLDVLNLIIKTVAVYRTRISLAFYFKRPREADARRSAVWQFGQKKFRVRENFFSFTSPKFFLSSDLCLVKSKSDRSLDRNCVDVLQLSPLLWNFIEPDSLIASRYPARYSSQILELSGNFVA